MVYQVDLLRGAASLAKEDLNMGFVYIVRLSGNLVMEVTDEFSLLVNTLVQGGMKKAVLDLTNLKYVDSAGIGAFINLTKLIRSRGGDLAFLGVHDGIVETLRLVKLHEYIPFFRAERQVADHFFAVRI